MEAGGSKDLSVHWVVISLETKTDFFVSRLMFFPLPRHLNSSSERDIEPIAGRLPVSAPPHIPLSAVSLYNTFTLWKLFSESRHVN